MARLDSLIDILMTTKSETPELQHTRMSGTPFYWRDALGDKNKGPLTDEDIDIIAEAKKNDPASLQTILTFESKSFIVGMFRIKSTKY